MINLTGSTIRKIYLIDRFVIIQVNGNRVFQIGPRETEELYTVYYTTEGKPREMEGQIILEFTKHPFHREHGIMFEIKSDEMVIRFRFHKKKIVDNPDYAEIKKGSPRLQEYGVEI
jgi:hypothetical protein